MRNCSLRVLASLAVTFVAVGAFAVRRDQKERVETRVISREIPTEVRYEFSREVGAGRLILRQSGIPGSIKRTYSVHVRGDRVIAKDLVKIERVEPTPTVYYMGRQGYQASRHASYRRSRVMVMSATAYDPSPQTIGPGATGRTCTGMKADYGVVAVDPRVIPLGTLVFVEGYGYAIAADRGGAIKGHRIDLCYKSRRVADAFGRRKVRVHILKPR